MDAEVNYGDETSLDFTSVFSERNGVSQTVQYQEIYSVEIKYFKCTEFFSNLEMPRRNIFRYSSPLVTVICNTAQRLSIALKVHSKL